MKEEKKKFSNDTSLDIKWSDTKKDSSLIISMPNKHKNFGLIFAFLEVYKKYICSPYYETMKK